MTQHLYYQTSGSRTTPSGMISPMSPEWNLNTAARYGPLKQRKGSTSKALCQPSLSKSAASLDLWKKTWCKNTQKKHIQTHQNTTFDQHVTCWSSFETHIRKIGKTKAIFSSALIAKLLSALAACNSQNRWNYLTAGSFTKYYPQHSPKLFSAPFPSSCCKQALFNHFFCVICLCSFFVSLLPPTSNSGAASHPNFSPTAAGGAIWMHLPRSFISYRDFAESHSDELSINSTFWCTTIQASSERFKQCSKPIIGWFIGIPRSWITDDDDDDDDDVVNPQFPVESPGKRTLVQALSVQR